MTQDASFPSSLAQEARRLAPRTWLLGVAALCLGLVTVLVPDGPLRLLPAGLALTLVFLAFGIHALSLGHGRRLAALHRAMERLVEHDAAPCFTTDADGRIEFQNQAALERFGRHDGASFLRALGALFASPAAVVYRLQQRAEREGRAREDVALHRGLMRLSVQRVSEGRFLWRLEDAGAGSPTAQADPARAIPTLVLGERDTVLYQNAALRRLTGRPVSRLGDLLCDPPLRAGEIQAVITARGPSSARLIEHRDDEGRRILLVLTGAADAPLPEPGLFDALPVPLIEITPQGGLRHANRLARALLGVEAAADQPLASLVEGLGRPVGEWLTEIASGQRRIRPEIVRASRRDTDLYLQITLGRMEPAEAGHLVAVLHDATELKSLEAQFVQSQKMQAIGQLAGGVAHDFNNLLTAISGHCDLLLLRHDVDDADYADLEQINQNANRAASLVGQLLAFSRKQNLQPELLDLRDTLADLTHLLNRLVGERITLSFDHDPRLTLVRADPRQLEQVIMNLVVNARDAMPDGGAITIETRAEILHESTRRDRVEMPPGAYVVVRVADTGHGIPADQLSKIFEPFFTTKPTGEGTGLGLSTAYGIVKQTGGFIFADSTPGEGTEFTIYFPAYDRPAADAAPTRGRAGEPGLRPGDGVVLLVEDEAPVRAFAVRALRMRGYTVIEAENAEQALTILSDEGLNVDCFVTDVVMPGMDGPTWVQKALEARPDTRVVFVSGYTEETVAHNRARIANAVFLPKPFSLNQLTATVQQQVEAGGASGR